MLWSSVLLVIGMFLLCVELFAPGFGIFGILGLVSIISSFIWTCFQPYGFLYVIGELVILLVVGYIIIRYIKSKQLYGKIILNENLNDDVSEIGNPDVFIGKEGVCVTPLRPFGLADFNGTQIEVYSEKGYIDSSTQVSVTKILNRKLYVAPLYKN